MTEPVSDPHRGVAEPPPTSLTWIGQRLYRLAMLRDFYQLLYEDVRMLLGKTRT